MKNKAMQRTCQINVDRLAPAASSGFCRLLLLLRVLILIIVIIFVTSSSSTSSSTSTSDDASIKYFESKQREFLVEYRSHRCDIPPAFFVDVQEEVFRKCGAETCVRHRCEYCTLDFCDQFDLELGHLIDEGISEDEEEQEEGEKESSEQQEDETLSLSLLLDHAAPCLNEASTCSSLFENSSALLPLFSLPPLKSWYRIEDLISKFQELSADLRSRKDESSTAFGNHLLLDTLWPSYFENKRGDSSSFSSRTPKPRVFHDDLVAWKDFYDEFGGLRWARCHEHRERPCLCSHVQCSNIILSSVSASEPTANLRITAMVFPNLRFIGRLPASIGKLSELRVLDLTDATIFHVPSSLSQLKQLRIMSFSLFPFVNLPPDLDLPQLVRADLTGIRSEAVNEALNQNLLHKKALQGEKLSFPNSFNSTFDAVLPLCRLVALKYLQLHHFEGPILECLGGLSSLVRLILNSNYVGGGLPPSLGNLSELRTFYSFHNGEAYCPLQDAQVTSDSTSLSIPRKDKGLSLANVCRSKYVVSAELALGESAWVCREKSLSGPIPDSYARLSKLEKFWVDANFLEGPIPEWIGASWPNMRSLDFYDNNFSGPLPEGLGRLLKLEQLQLQRNHFSGVIPQSIVSLPRLRLLQLTSNPNLEGCLEQGSRPPFLKVILARTKVHERANCGSHLEL